jgi:hypothetical protein
MPEPKLQADVLFLQTLPLRRDPSRPAVLTRNIHQAPAEAGGNAGVAPVNTGIEAWQALDKA